MVNPKVCNDCIERAFLEWQSRRIGLNEINIGVPRFSHSDHGRREVDANRNRANVPGLGRHKARSACNVQQMSLR